MQQNFQNGWQLCVWGTFDIKYSMKYTYIKLKYKDHCYFASTIKTNCTNSLLNCIWHIHLQQNTTLQKLISQLILFLKTCWNLLNYTWGECTIMKNYFVFDYSSKKFNL
jgi:hypothetical protein